MSIICQGKYCVKNSLVKKSPQISKNRTLSIFKIFQIPNPKSLPLFPQYPKLNLFPCPKSSNTLHLSIPKNYHKSKFQNINRSPSFLNPPIKPFPLPQISKYLTFHKSPKIITNPTL